MWQAIQHVFSIGACIVIEYTVEYQKLSPNFSHSIEITNSDGVPIFHLWDMDSRSGSLSRKRRVVRARVDNTDLFPIATLSHFGRATLKVPR